MKINYFLVVMVSLITVSAHAKFYEPESDSQFYRYIERHGLTIVFFEPYDVAEDKESALEEMDSAFERLSRRDRYKDADLAFIAVELDGLPELIDDFRLEIEKPTIMLFKNGKVVKKGDEVFKDVGFLNKAELEDLIDEYFATDIDKKLQRKKEIERIREQERQKQEQQSKVLPSKTLPVQQAQPVEKVEYVTYPSRTTTYIDDGYGYGGYGGPYFGIGFGRPFWGRRGFGGWRGGGRRRGFGRRGFGGGRGRRGGGGRRGGRGGRGRR